MLALLLSILALLLHILVDVFCIGMILLLLACIADHFFSTRKPWRH